MVQDRFGFEFDQEESRRLIRIQQFKKGASYLVRPFILIHELASADLIQTAEEITHGPEKFSWCRR